MASTGTEATVRRKGCEPADAISERVEDLLMPFAYLPKGTFYIGWGGNPEQRDFLLAEASGAAIMVLARQPFVTAALLANKLSENRSQGTDFAQVRRKEVSPWRAKP
jgi:hypothetical protein